MKVTLYARVATQRPGDNRAILQIEGLRAHASKQGFEVMETYVCYDPGYSGASLDRPGLNRLRYYFCQSCHFYHLQKNNRSRVL